MHIVMFADQHVETLGGAQVSTRLQRRYLERAGHTVTIVAPRRHGPRSRIHADDPAYADLPSMIATIDREYSVTWPGRRADGAVERALRDRPAPDVVHVQADFWGAFLGYRYARRHGLPVVHTMHNRVDVGLRATTPFPELLLRGLNLWRRRALPGTGRGTDGWAYLRGLASGASAVTAPSGHFARRLESHGVFPAVDAIWNGMDDDLLDRMRAERVEPAAPPAVPTFLWVGRMSPEKRLLPFLEAVARAGAPMRVEVIGGGAQSRAARRVVARYGLGEIVTFLGGLPYEQTLARIAAADALVQTSIGFETQGMTPFEAAALGTPSVMSDPDIAAEVGAGVWRVGEPGHADASVDALAATLRRAAADIRSGTAPAPDPSVRERFRQSASTAQMLAVYERVLAR
ncbi:glycosyltransferase [Microbacterium sediminis]|uniref:glycosyltransferase n=1 Tax=Microbacterium sediminis TaxID=904291 RepID=UPI001072539B|nr:glycosyltransferase [Microbacterium sediminis]QBR75245.1 glycosyltransferase [Microbacterium sediminis]